MGYFQVFFLLSEKGVDYREGGAYVERDERRNASSTAADSGLAISRSPAATSAKFDGTPDQCFHHSLS